MKAKKEFTCRWCSRTSPTAPGIAAHERFNHPKEWKASRTLEPVLAAIKEDPAPPVIPDEPEIREYLEQLPEELNTTTELQTLVGKLQTKIEMCQAKIAELKTFEALLEETEHQKGILMDAIEKISPTKH